MAARVKQSLVRAASALQVRNPVPIVSGLIDRTFSLPEGDVSYGENALTPGAVPFEPSFSEQEPNLLRFTIEPLGPRVSPATRRDEATREMRRLVLPEFGPDALKWFDARSEEWRGLSGLGWMSYGAWFGSAFDEDGLYGAKVYYELRPEQVDALAPNLALITRRVMSINPNLMPIFTSIGCNRDAASQRVSFMHRGPLSIPGLAPLLQELGCAHQLPSIMRVVGVALGGRFELPHGAVLLGLRNTPEGPELKLEILLSALSDLPAGFLGLLRLGLAERPRQLAALERWLDAFDIDSSGEPGSFSVLSVRVTPQSSARVSLYVRPIEFELRDNIEDRRFNA
jgi:hypothetical protein